MKKATITQIIKYVILFILAILTLTPIVMMLLGAVKDSTQAMEFDLSWPTQFHWDNFTHVLEKGNIVRGYMNSIMITITTTVLTVVTGGFAGIIIGRRKDAVASALYYYVLFGLTMTLQTASTFGLLKMIGLYGSQFAVIFIITGLQLPFTVMTCTSFIKGVPKDLDEAAIVDGCKPIQMIVQILFPILKPVLVTCVVITSIASWNNFMVPLFYLSSSKQWPVPLTIYNFFGQYASDWNYVFAALTLTVLPVIILFLCLQKYIVEGMVAGAVKG